MPCDNPANNPPFLTPTKVKELVNGKSGIHNQ